MDEVELKVRKVAAELEEKKHVPSHTHQASFPQNGLAPDPEFLPLSKNHTELRTLQPPPPLSLTAIPYNRIHHGNHRPGEQSPPTPPQFLRPLPTSNLLRSGSTTTPNNTTTHRPTNHRNRNHSLPTRTTPIPISPNNIPLHPQPRRQGSQTPRPKALLPLPRASQQQRPLAPEPVPAAEERPHGQMDRA